MNPAGPDVGARAGDTQVVGKLALRSGYEQQAARLKGRLSLLLAVSVLLTGLFLALGVRYLNRAVYYKAADTEQARNFHHMIEWLVKIACPSQVEKQKGTP